MSVEVLVHAFTHSKAQKGTIQDVRDVGELNIRPWGRREGLPNFVRLRIRDAGKLDITPFLVSVKNEFLVSQKTNSGRTRTYDIRVKDLRVLTKFGNTKGATLVFVEGLNRDHTARFISRELDNSRLTITARDTTSAALADDILDMFQETLSPRRFHIDSLDVDLAITAGGFLEVNASQVIPRIIDGLD